MHILPILADVLSYSLDIQQTDPSPLKYKFFHVNLANNWLGVILRIFFLTEDSSSAALPVQMSQILYASLQKRAKYFTAPLHLC